ncbi:thiosulfate oxidation carrier complex protein SoxZ [Aquabacterium sp. OR-4]|uniref:thiosulfate oxidation carrier complex protein SoxZ n=1 Tax=Aquabacterium sp. OR-4 TaxID=2978127 RepID=UPI0021B181D1|nr:thiosulfate oxidation carrier complex protein SoxZ [Aquabacterium sp. OR-4]MDT7835888.1 thiosulfate oxidation carrier complex protein SoxZ [Aquabacterium sp. OR-4]
MTARTLIHLPSPVPRGELVQLRLTIGHPMEVGLRWQGDGNMTPRNILTRFECRLDGTPVFTADLYQAVAANPYIAFWLRAERSGLLEFTWSGDYGFRHQEHRPFEVL